MATVIYKSLSSLAPIFLNYQFSLNEPLNYTVDTYKTGHTFFTLQGLKNYQDVAISNGSCFILTSATSLSNIFSNSDTFNIGTLPGSLKLQSRDSTSLYVTYKDNIFTQDTSDNASTFYVYPVPGTNQVELLVNNSYVQVDQYYPYTVKLGNVSLGSNNINRQRFYIVYQNNCISFYTLTDNGYRYLSLNKYDYTLRATGTVLNNIAYNDYIFNYIPVTTSSLQQGFVPTNNWVSYFYDIQTGSDNKTLTINSDITNTPTNLLIDFPTENSIDDGTANINIANLKTNLTPTGGPAPYDNTYLPNVTTSNY